MVVYFVYGLYGPVVGIPGFEPGTSNSRSWRANRTALHPEQVVGGYLFYRVEINGIARVPAFVVRAVVAICLQQGPYCYGPLVCYVGIPGFEPGTPCSQSRCANRTALHPDNLIDSGDKSILKISNLQIFRAFFSENINFFGRCLPYNTREASYCLFVA